MDLSTLQEPQISTVPGEIGAHIIKEYKSIISFPHACAIPTFFFKVEWFSQCFSRVPIHEISDKTFFRSDFDLASCSGLTIDIIPKTYFFPQEYSH